jgi:hypothetical protein
MTTDYAISTTQATLIQQATDRLLQAQAALDGLYTIILAGHDVTTGGRCSLTSPTTITVVTDDPPPEEAS